MIDQAVIPAAGRGLRLDRPGTPKPLVDVGGQPMVVRLIRQLERAQVGEVVVVTGYEGEKIEKALRKYDFDTALTFQYNPDWTLGISGSVLAAEPKISKPFLLAMADHVFDDEAVVTMAGLKLGEGDGAAMVDFRLNDIFALASAVKVAARQRSTASGVSIPWVFR